ncbi:MAG TPA: exosortase-associated EpsI family protein, partial [Isosphaeraceae bacterium]
MTRIFLTLTALTVVTASGIAHGLITHRWTARPDLREEIARPGKVAMTVGDWEGRELELDSREMAAAEIVGGFLRQYVNRKDGRSMTVLLVCGAPGPISVHTPDVCFPGIGYDASATPTKVALAVPSGSQPTTEFWTTLLTKPGGVVPTSLRIYWTWGGAGRWAAPSNPRLNFASLPLLYKLYVLCPASDPPTPPEGG